MALIKPEQLRSGSYNITGSLFGTSSFAITASYAMNGGGTSIDTGSFATTGSNLFSGSQTINGELYITGSDGVNSAIRFVSGASITTLGPNIDMTAGPGGWSELGSNNGQNYVWVDDTAVYLVASWDGNTVTSAWSIATGSRKLTAVGDLDMNGNSITGSLFGTASYALNTPTPFRISTGSISASVNIGPNIFIVTNNNQPVLTVSQSGVVILSTQSVELTGPAPNGGMYFTSASFFIGLD